MLIPKKVKHRKWFTMRQNPKRESSHCDTRGTDVSFGSYGLKAMAYARVTPNQIESARKVMTRYVSKTGKIWIRVFPDHPFTQKPAEVKMGKGKGDLVGFIAEVKPGKIIFEIDGVDEATAAEALRKAGTKLPVKTRMVARQ